MLWNDELANELTANDLWLEFAGGGEGLREWAAPIGCRPKSNGTTTPRPHHRPPRLLGSCRTSVSCVRPRSNCPPPLIQWFFFLLHFFMLFFISWIIWFYSLNFNIIVILLLVHFHFYLFIWLFQLFNYFTFLFDSFKV